MKVNVGERFGFIEQEGDQRQILCLPTGCQGLQNVLPPIGLRVSYKIVVDRRSGKLRGDEVTLAPPGSSADDATNGVATNADSITTAANSKCRAKCRREPPPSCCRASWGRPGTFGCFAFEFYWEL